MSPYDLNFRHLLAVSAIAQLGSVSRAAGEVHLSQPALTQALVKLEQQFGHRLFDRRPDGMSPTAAGAEVVERIDRAANELARAFELEPTEASARLAPDSRAMLRRVSFTQLRAVIAAVDSGNFVLATRATGISAPSIHRAVRDLERLAGVALFERRGRSVAPTAHARRFVSAARRAVAEIEAAVADLGALRGESGGRVAVGAMPLARARLIPEAVAAFHRAEPGATVAIVDGAYSELLSRLLAGELDVLVGALRQPHPSPEVMQTPLYVDQLAVVSRRGHPLTKGRVDAASLAGFPWIMAPRSTPMRAVWEDLFRREGVAAPAVAVECSSILAIHGLLVESDWLTLLSPEQVSREVEAGRLALIGPPLAGGERTIGMTTRAGWKPSAVQALFLQYLRAQVWSRDRLTSQD